MSRARGWVALAALLMAACGGEGPVVPETDAGPPETDAFVPFTATDVETIAPASVRAGDPFMVNCLLVDANGETQTPPPGTSSTLRLEPEGSIERSGDTYVATRAGQIEVACSFATLALADTSPAIVEVVPGPVAYVEARVDRDSLVAGESASASCFAVDQYGNTVTELDASLRADPAADGNTFEGTTGTFQRAGIYDVYCDVAGAESRGARLEVVPALPASLVIALVPDQPVYAVGQVITLARIVEDRFGNRIEDVEVPVTSSPRGGIAVGDGRYRYAVDGRYTLTATVTPPTQDDVPLTASVEILVDSGGPQIRCDSPADAAILNQAPGSTVTFRGSVSDLSGITGVRVNGSAVGVDSDGNFSRSLVTGFGINFVDVAATDGTGRESSRTCAFLVADQWAPTAGSYSDTLSLRLTQTAIDDNNRSGSLNSLSDILNTVITSSGLRSTLHSQLVASNPIKPSSCDQNLCVPIVGCACVLRSEVIYLNSQLNGPNSATLTLVNGGLAARVTLNDTRVQLRVRGSVSGIPYDTTGWVTFSNIVVNATFDIGLSGGRPRITVRPGSVSTTVGSISTSFSGLDGAIIDIVASIANGTLRNLVRDLVTNWVRDNFNSILDGVVGNLDISTLGTSFNVPRLDGSGNIALSFSPSFTSLSTSSTRALFGIGTRLTATAAHARPTLGTPIPSGTVLLDPSTTQSTAVSLHVGVLGQAVHALWRGGFFDATLDSGEVSGLPAGVSARLTTLLPPAVQIRSGRVELALGAVGVQLTYPALFAQPIQATLGARASMRVQLSGNELRFDDVRIDELHFSTTSVDLDQATRDTVEDLLTRILGRVVTSALNDALPAVPIPAFTLPASLSTYGLPAGRDLGLVSPVLTTGSRHFTLAGSFGLR